jgi:hypothetical protein
MKIKLLAAFAAVGGLALAGTAGAQVVGGAVGGTVSGAVGGVVGQSPSASGSATGSVNAGASAQQPGATVPSVGLPPVSTPSTTPPLPSATPSVTAPSTSTTVKGSANANANASAASTVAPVNLTGLATGMTVRDVKGRAVGKVSRIVKRADGTISAVEVAAANKAGKTISVAPSSLNVASGAVIMSDTNASTTPQ